ncbi:MAG: GNAT family N-acetyltransferase [Bacteroidales bacterium]
MTIERYSAEHKDKWNQFIEESRNGTFLFHRDFMEYHADRFFDFSLLFYKKNRLVAVLPCHVNNGIAYTHQGLTYGGLITKKQATTALIQEVLFHLISYLRKYNISQFVYKAVPHIYSNYPCQEDLYMLSQLNANLYIRSISSVIDRREPIQFSLLRKRQILKAEKLGLEITKSSDYASFWDLLSANLLTKHNVKPVHTLEEITRLASLFPNNIQLFTVHKKTDLLGGCVLFITDKTIHTQYISANDNGKKSGALDLLFQQLINTFRRDIPYFDFGISTENKGLHLNKGLIHQKEGFGARGVVYDQYILDL